VPLNCARNSGNSIRCRGRGVLRDQFLRLASALCRAYLQFSPWTAGKRFIWDKVVRRYISWRILPIVATTKFGAKMHGAFPDAVHTYLYFFGVWEPGLTRLMEKHLRPGDSVIDIGANVGAHSMLAAHIVGKSGRVFAIEASPTIFKKLNYNIKKSGFSQITAINIAVTDKRGPVTVYLHAGHNLGGTSLIREQLDGPEQATEMNVEGRPLPEIIPPEVIRTARLIKIDVEGAEWALLQGMRNFLETINEECVILLEANSDALRRFGVGISDVLDMFGSAGWSSFQTKNSYNGDFYFRTPKCLFTAEVCKDARMVDLGFCRPAMFRKLVG